MYGVADNIYILQTKNLFFFALTNKEKCSCSEVNLFFFLLQLLFHESKKSNKKQLSKNRIKKGNML